MQNKKLTHMENMTNNNGKAIANQYIITELNQDGVNRIFQSYNSTIACINFGTKKITIGENWNKSTTTSKYRNRFFAQYFEALNTTDKIKKAIERGVVNVSDNYGRRIVFKVSFEPDEIKEQNGEELTAKVLNFKTHGKNYKERKDSVRQLAMEYQQEATECKMYWSQLAEISAKLRKLGERYHLTEELEENGII